MTAAPTVDGLVATVPVCGCPVTFDWPGEPGEHVVVMRASCDHRPWQLKIELAEGRWPRAGQPPYTLPDGHLAAPCWCERTMLVVPTAVLHAGETGTCGLARCHAPSAA